MGNFATLTKMNAHWYILYTLSVAEGIKRYAQSTSNAYHISMFLVVQSLFQRGIFLDMLVRKLSIAYGLFYSDGSTRDSSFRCMHLIHCAMVAPQRIGDEMFLKMCFGVR